MNEKYPPDCIEYQVLLPVHLLKFQVAHDGSQRSLEAEKRQLLEKSPTPALGPLDCCTVSAAAVAAAKPDDQHREPAVVTYEPASFTAAELSGKSVATTYDKAEEGDELDMLVAEVQATADLVTLN